MITATPNTQPNTNNSDSSSPVSPQPVKLSNYIKDTSPQKNSELSTTTTTQSVNTTTNNENSDTTQPKKKIDLKLILGVIVLLLILLGSGAGFYLSQQQQELRQQAYVGSSCSTSDQCNANQKTPGTTEYCVQGTCNTSANSMCAFSACDAECGLTSCNVSCNSGLNCSTGKNTFYCRGQHASCNSANSFKDDDSGSVNSTLADNWCTTYQIDAWARNNVNGSIEESAAEVGFIGRNGKVCKWNDSACISSDPNFWNCEPEEPVYQCNSDCTTNAQCTGSLGTNYSCVTNKCRLTANPTSATCQPTTVYQCNSDCTTNAQCTGSLGANYSCVTNKCRLTANPTSATCQPETPVAPMCKDVAILDEDNAELDPKAVPSSFYIGQVIKLRCAPDNVQNPQIEKYQFRITEPDNVVIEGNALNPSGNSAISLPYQITKSGTFKAQCRICLTGGTCQPYIDITN